MRVVEPQSRTSLVLNRNFQATGAFCTARAAVRHLITNRMKGMDADGNVFDWEGDISWSKGNVALFEDQPCLRSAHDKHWAIPTILICTDHFGFFRRRGESVSLKVLYKVYKGICQYCLTSVPYGHATKDHLYPKSKGGSNDDFNLVLACRKCNSEKDDIYPYHNVNGQEVKARRTTASGVFIPDRENIRDEWKCHLHID